MTLRQEKIALASLVAAFMLPGFVWVSSMGRAYAIPPPRWLITPVDVAVPFVPGAVWAYVSWYPASFAILLAGRENFRRLSFAELGAFLLCSTVHLLWPISIDRPSLDGLVGPSATVLRALYSLDSPVSLFPSFHAAVAPIMLQLRPRSPFVRVGLVAWMTSICVSCVLIKQHYVFDVLAGVAAGRMAVAAVDAAQTWLVRFRNPATQAVSAGERSLSPLYTRPR